MSSFDDYDEFGNYIGGDLDSDDEDEVMQEQQQQPSAAAPAPLEGYEDDAMDQDDSGALMQVDGAC